MFKRDKSYDYFDYFVRFGAHILDAAAHMYAVVTNYDYAKIEQYKAEMHRIENQADADKHDMTEKLLHEFITPIEREDIMALAHQADEVVDALDELILRLYMYRAETMHAGAEDFAKLILDCCEQVAQTLPLMRDFKKPMLLRQHIVKINTLESDGDVLYTALTRELFSKKDDPLYNIVWMRILSTMESCLDACEHVADVMENIILKNS